MRRFDRMISHSLGFSVNVPCGGKAQVILADKEKDLIMLRLERGVTYKIGTKHAIFSIESDGTDVVRFSYKNVRNCND